jgi:8-oxo-dGTP pyrophosphatase MutT (NUDIX family)
MNYTKQKQTHTCRNCGAFGHLYKNCNKPIMSFGIICYRLNEANNEYEYLMIQRRDSLSFMEFIRGKYDVYNFEYIKHLMLYMTEYEKNMLLTLQFDDLWNHVWYQPYMPKQTQEYLDAKEKFLILKEGVLCLKEEKQVLVTLKLLLNETKNKYSEPEWGFPKGRRKLREKDIDCALREFFEETGFTKQDIELDPDQIAYEEIFYGTNNIRYRHVYYIAKIVNNVYKNIVIDNTNPQQAREVRQVKWFSAEQVNDKIRDHNKERKVLFQQIIKDIKK